MPEGKSRFQYFKVYQEIKDKIEQGKIKPGEKLPTEKELQEEGLNPLLNLSGLN